MKKRLTMLVPQRKLAFISLLLALLMSVGVKAQLPTAQSIASQMKVGWNLGNTLEAICSETIWGGATTTQQWDVRWKLLNIPPFQTPWL